MYRWFYALLLALLLAPPALAGPPPATAGNAVFAPLDRDKGEPRDDRDRHEEDGRGKGEHDDEKRKDDEREGKEPERETEREHDEGKRSPEEREGETYDDDYAYYGRVQATAPEVVVGSRVLAGDLALLDFLAPGMRVEVEGRVENGRLRVRELHVLFPRDWAYYEGPTPEGWARVWYAAGEPWRSQAADPGPRVRLLACFEEDWRGLPEELHPALHPSRPGLWLLEGLVWQGQVRWTRQTRLGACDE